MASGYLTPTKAPPVHNTRSSHNKKKEERESFYTEFWSGKDHTAPDVPPAEWPTELTGATHLLPVDKLGGGHRVVFFINTPKTILVLKAPSVAMSDFGGESHAAMLASQLGLSAPSSSIFHKEETEGVKSFISQIQNGKSLKSPEADDIKGLCSALRTSTPYVFLLELVDGVTLQGMEMTELSDDLITGTLMRQIGQVLAFDLWINNTDRLPVKGVWDHAGNFGNLMYNKREGKIMVIDQTTATIPDKSRAKMYVAKVHVFLSTIVEKNLPEAGVLELTVDRLQAACNIKLLPEDFQAMRHGIIEMAVKIASLPDGILPLWRSKRLDDMARRKAETEDRIRALGCGWGKLAVNTDVFLTMLKDEAFRPSSNAMLISAADDMSSLCLDYVPASVTITSS